MLCIASFIVLLILSVFSARFRPYVKEAYDCVFRRLTFRPCTTGFDVKVRSKIVVELSRKSERLAGLFNRYFEVISWIFVVSFFVSLIYSSRGVYLFWTTGSCNGLNQGGFCVLDPSGESNAVSGTGVECRTGGNPTGNLSLAGVGINKQTIVFMGCYACKYSKQTFPLIRKLSEQYSVPVEYVFYPTHKEAEYLTRYDYAIKLMYPEKYEEWVVKMYGLNIEEVANKSSVDSVIIGLGIDLEAVEKVASDSATVAAAQKFIYEVDKTGIYGTPTVFINEKPVVGPKPYRVYRIMLTESLF